MDSNDLAELFNAYKESPEPSYKVTSFFRIYSKLLSEFRYRPSVIIETGILNGGSLFMWRKWFGKSARIIGVDLNPQAKKWEQHGFEIYIGDQADPVFWDSVYAAIGTPFDVLIDDGGHQSIQQMVTLESGMAHVRDHGVILIEDTYASFMAEFSAHRVSSFLEYAKDATDLLNGRVRHFNSGSFPKDLNEKMIKKFDRCYSIEFFCGLVAFKFDPYEFENRPMLCWNRAPAKMEKDFRFEGKQEALIDWPDLFTKKTIQIRGGKV